MSPNESDTPELDFKVTADEAESRLDSFLVAKCPEFSRTRIQADLSGGKVSVNGRNRNKSFRLSEGDQIHFAPTPLQPLTAVPQDIPLDVVFEDESVLVLNKPIDMVVHPATGHPDGTLVNALLYHCKTLSVGGDELRPGIVHRLDKDTSGIMAVALTDVAHRSLSDQLQTRSMGRTYRAISWGSWNDDEGTLKGDIGRHPTQRHKMAVVERGGREAVTRYRVLEDFGFAQYCEIELETGRTHQIRVHFALRGHPIVGDHLYGNDKRAKGVHPLDRGRADRLVAVAKRQLLHAIRLHFRHPVTDEEMSFETPLASDIEKALEDLRAT